MAKKGTQIMALIALFCIVGSAVSTGILVLFSGQNNNQQETEFTEEELKQLQELLNSQSGTISSSGETTNTGEITN